LLRTRRSFEARPTPSPRQKSLAFTKSAEDAHNRSVEARWDAQDKSNQAFSNYLLDQTVIQDNLKGTHSTEWNQTADALVKSDPQRYQYVDTPNFWKGVDY
jgi:hypothetical protein